MEFKAARQAIADVADIAENFSATPPQADATGFWLTNVFYECGPTGRPINPQYYSFHVEAAGSLTVLGLTPGFGGSMSYWVRIEGAGYYTYSGRMYCDADTVAGYQWLVQPGPPNFQLLALGDAIQRAQVRYVQALNDLEGVLEDLGNILPGLLEEANGALSFTRFLNEVLENPNIGAVIQHANALSEAEFQGRWYMRAGNIAEEIVLRTVALPFYNMYRNWKRFDHLNKAGVNGFAAAIDALTLPFYEDFGIAGVYTGFTHEDLYTGQTYSEGEAQWKGFVGGMTVVLTATGVAEVFIPARSATVVMGLGTRAEANAASKLPLGKVSPKVTVYRVEGLPNTRIIIGESGEVAVVGNNERMLFLNFGDRARASAFFEQKLAGGMQGVQLKSFEVPKSFLDDLRASAVPQRLGQLFPDRPQLVDPTKAADQFGLRPAQIEELRKQIIQGSGKCVR